MVQPENGNKNSSYYYYNEYKNKKVNLVLSIISAILFVLGLGFLFLKIFVKDSINSISNYFQLSNGGGELLGTILVIVILFTLIAFIFKNKKGVITIVISVIYLFYSIASAGMTIVVCAKEDAEKNKLAITEKLNMEHDYESNKDVSAVKLDKKTYGRLTPLLIVLKNHFVNVKKIDDDLDKKIDNSKLAISTDTYSSTDKINIIKQNANNLDKIWDDYKEKRVNEENNTLNNISKLKIPKSCKEGFIKNYSENENEFIEDIDNHVDAEKDYDSKVITLMDYVLSVQGKYLIENNKVMFYSQDDLNKCNSYDNDIDQAANKINEIDKKNQEKEKQSLSDIDKNLKENSSTTNFFMGLF